MSVEAQRQVVCPGCGDVRWLSARNARDVVRGERPGLCTRCRFPPRTSAEEREAFCCWWLERFTDEELADLALALGVEGASSHRVAVQRASLGVRLGLRLLVSAHDEAQRQRAHASV